MNGYVRSARGMAIALATTVLITLAGAQPAEAAVVRRTIGDQLSAVAVDAQGDAFVVGTAGNAMLLAKYGPAGSLLWQRRWEPFAEGFVFPADVAVAPDGGVYVVGGVSIPHYEGGSWFISGTTYGRQ